MKSLFLLFFFISHSSYSANEKTKPELTIYTYNTIAERGGVGDVIFKEFAKVCQCSVNIKPFGDTGALLNELELEAREGKVKAQVVLGIDNIQWELARKFAADWSGGWTPSGYRELDTSLKLGQGFLPFDYGVLAWMVNDAALKKAGVEVPLSWLDLLKDKYRHLFLLEDPRASSPGMQLLLFTDEVFRHAFSNFWKSFRLNWLTLAPSWDSAYGLFKKGESPFVWSYSTSEAYHKAHKEPGYHAISLKEGAPVQIEGAFMVKEGIKSDAQLQLAQAFLSHLISPAIQREMPLKNWMYPARMKTPLPESFENLSVPKNKVVVRRSSERAKELIHVWETSIR